MAERERHTFAPLPARAMAEAALADIDAWRELPVEIEAERMRRRWTAHCCDQRRRPAITAAEKLRAAAISFDDTPREALAAAWIEATDRDRLDLVNRAMGRVVA